MIIKKSRDISIEDLEKIIKVSGDKIVTGYIRFKKVKPVNGYDEARKRAVLHFSVVSKAREIENNQYAVVVRFHPLLFIIPLIILGLIFAILQISTQAIEKEVPEYIPTQEPTIKEAESYVGMYISVPGFTKMDTSKDKPEIQVYNPSDNSCALLFEIYYDNQKIGESTLIIPGEMEIVPIKRLSFTGRYDIEIVAKGFSLEGDVAYNSVSQKIELNVF